MDWKVKRIYLITFSKRYQGLPLVLKWVDENPEFSEMSKFLYKLKAPERPQYEQIEIYTLTDPPITKIWTKK